MTLHRSPGSDIL